MDTNNRRTLDGLKTNSRPHLLLPARPLKHSLTDWDYHNRGNWQIWEREDAPSPPDCLMNRWEDQGDINPSVYLKTSLAPDLPNARLLTWTRVPTDWGKQVIFFFRVQALPTNWWPDNCYYVELRGLHWEIYQILDTEETEIGSFDFPNHLAIGTWQRWRFTFWEFVNPKMETVLRCILEAWVAGEWVEQDRYDIPDPLWGDSGVNRIGLGCHAHFVGGRYTQFDNTEIWGEE